MSAGALLVVFTAVEIVVLVVSLAGFLALYARQVRAIAAALRDATLAIGALERDARGAPVAVGDINRELEAIAGELPLLGERAKELAGRA